MIEDQIVMEISIGETLSKARIKRGISVKDAEKNIKIRSKYLSAIENNDYEQIPGQAYVLGFIKSYAGYLGLDVQALVTRYQRENEDLINQSNPFVIGDEKEDNKKSARKYLLFIFLIMIVALTIFIFRNNLFS